MPAPGEFCNKDSLESDFHFSLAACDEQEAARKISTGGDSNNSPGDSHVSQFLKTWLKTEVSEMLQNHLDQMDVRLDAALLPLKRSVDACFTRNMDTGSMYRPTQMPMDRLGSMNQRRRTDYPGYMGRRSSLAGANVPRNARGSASSKGSGEQVRKEVSLRAQQNSRMSIAAKELIQRSVDRNNELQAAGQGSANTEPLAISAEKEKRPSLTGSIGWEKSSMASSTFGDRTRISEFSLAGSTIREEPSAQSTVSASASGNGVNHRAPCRLPKPKAADHPDLDDMLPPDEVEDKDTFVVAGSSSRRHDLWSAAATPATKSEPRVNATPTTRESTGGNKLLNIDEDVRNSLESKKNSRASSGSAGSSLSHRSLHMPKGHKCTDSASSMPGFAELAENGKVSRALTTVLRSADDDIDHEQSSAATRIRVFLEDAGSSKAAWIFSIFMAAIIMCSSVTTILQTFRPSPFPSNFVPAVLETSFDVIFLLEVMVHWIVSANPLAFFCLWANLIDFLSAAPALALRIAIGFVPPDDVDDKDPIRFTLLCVVPIIRLLKMMRRFDNFNLLCSSAIELCSEILPVMIILLLLQAIFFASLIYAVEDREDIASLPHALWLTVVTMTTVGYGDITPKTGVGMSITTVLVISSAFYMAVPLGIVGNTFSNVWEDRDRLLMIQKARLRFLQAGYKPADIPDLFNLFGGESGELDLNDFQTMVEDMKIGINQDRIVALFNTFDIDGSGSIDHREFVRALFPSSYAAIYGTSYSDSVEFDSNAGSARSSFVDRGDGSSGRGSDVRFGREDVDIP